MGNGGLSNGAELFEITEREAIDHINDLQASSGCNPAEHNKVTKASVFSMRVGLATLKKLDRMPDAIIKKMNGNGNGKPKDAKALVLEVLQGMAVRAPYVFGAIVLFGMWMYSKYKGWL